MEHASDDIAHINILIKDVQTQNKLDEHFIREANNNPGRYTLDVVTARAEFAQKTKEFLNELLAFKSILS